MIEVLGWIGSILLAFCPFPQTIKCVKDGHSDGLAWGFLISWFLGEGILVPYSIIKDAPVPIIINYSINFILLCVVVKYKIWPRKNEQTRI